VPSLRRNECCMSSDFGQSELVEPRLSGRLPKLGRMIAEAAGPGNREPRSRGYGTGVASALEMAVIRILQDTKGTIWIGRGTWL
jgi:hypothetical protein